MKSASLSRFSHYRKLIPHILPFFLAAVFLVLFGQQFIRQVIEYEVNFQKNNLLSRVHVLSAAIGLDDVKALSGNETDIAKEEYRRLKNQLIKVARADPHLRFAYLMQKKGGKVIFLVDSEKENSPDYSPPGEV